MITGTKYSSYKVTIKLDGRDGYLEVRSRFGAWGAWLKVLWWRLTGNVNYFMWRHWPIHK